MKKLQIACDEYDEEFIAKLDHLDDSVKLDHQDELVTFCLTCLAHRTLVKFEF